MTSYLTPWVPTVLSAVPLAGPTDRPSLRIGGAFQELLAEVGDLSAAAQATASIIGPQIPPHTQFDEPAADQIISSTPLPLPDPYPDAVAIPQPEITPIEAEHQHKDIVVQVAKAAGLTISQPNQNPVNLTALAPDNSLPSPTTKAPQANTAASRIEVAPTLQADLPDTAAISVEPRPAESSGIPGAVADPTPQIARQRAELPSPKFASAAPSSEMSASTPQRSEIRAPLPRVEAIPTRPSEQPDSEKLPLRIDDRSISNPMPNPDQKEAGFELRQVIGQVTAKTRIASETSTYSPKTMAPAPALLSKTPIATSPAPASFIAAVPPFASDSPALTQTAIFTSPSAIPVPAENPNTEVTDAPAPDVLRPSPPSIFNSDLTITVPTPFYEIAFHPASSQTTPFAPASAAPVTMPAIAPMLVELAQVGSAGQIDIALAPEELGRVRLTMVPDGDTIRITLQAERPETTELLRRHTEAFSFELRQAGFAGASFSFSSWGQSPSHPQPSDPAKNTATSEAMQATVTTANIYSDKGLDLRL